MAGAAVAADGGDDASSADNKPAPIRCGVLGSHTSVVPLAPVGMGCDARGGDPRPPRDSGGGGDCICVANCGGVMGDPRRAARPEGGTPVAAGMYRGAAAAATVGAAMIRRTGEVHGSASISRSRSRSRCCCCCSRCSRSRCCCRCSCCRRGGCCSTVLLCVCVPPVTEGGVVR